MVNIAASRKFQTAALSLLSALLLLGFFFLYLRSGEGAPLELTGNAPAAGSQPATGTGLAAIGIDPALQLQAAAEPPLRIYVAGAVQEPGVYDLKPGDRLVEGVQAAGGGTATADLEAVNLALRVQDAGYYFIPARATPAEKPAPDAGAAPENPSPAIARIAADPLSGELPAAAGEEAEPGTLNGRIDLNTATQQQLETLPGIGPARAQSIIGYREQNGPFTASDEITAVSGIGPGIFNNLQGLITVGTSP